MKMKKLHRMAGQELMRVLCMQVAELEQGY